MKPNESVVVHWWKTGRFQTRERFIKHHAEWRRLKGEGKTKEAEAAYQRIVNMGLPVLPYLAEAVEKEPGLAPAISKLTDGAIPLDAKPSEFKPLWEKHKARFELPPVRNGGNHPATPPAQ